jgi:hypothetical protein
MEKPRRIKKHQPNHQPNRQLDCQGIQLITCKTSKIQPQIGKITFLPKDRADYDGHW